MGAQRFLEPLLDHIFPERHFGGVPVATPGKESITAKELGLGKALHPVTQIRDLLSPPFFLPS